MRNVLKLYRFIEFCIYVLSVEMHCFLACFLIVKLGLNDSNLTRKAEKGNVDSDSHAVELPLSS